jgi:hypothetical protein
MHVISVRNVHQALPHALRMMKEIGLPMQSRNGPVLVSPQPVATRYNCPLERVLFHPERDANPFFHFYEAMWMLAGRNDLAPLLPYVGNFGKFSDDKKTLHGAYGYRWRVGMPSYMEEELSCSREPSQLDQLRTIAEMLRKDRSDRRAVLQMWDARSDLNAGGLDLPCNDTATFQVGPDGRLDLVVFCRSNDIVLGAYGANAVHMSYLLEYVAARAGITPGAYTQVSVNWHGYDETFKPLVAAMDNTPRFNYPADSDPYRNDEVRPHPITEHRNDDMNAWDDDVRHLVQQTANGEWPRDRQYYNSFFNDVAVPIIRAHARYKTTEQSAQRYELAFEELRGCCATDWRRACWEWVDRRYKRWQVATDDGPQSVQP